MRKKDFGLLTSDEITMNDVGDWVYKVETVLINIKDAINKNPNINTKIKEYVSKKIKD